MNIQSASATQLAQGIVRGDFTAEEVVGAYIERIQDTDASVNAFTMSPDFVMPPSARMETFFFAAAWAQM